MVKKSERLRIGVLASFKMIAEVVLISSFCIAFVALLAIANALITENVQDSAMGWAITLILVCAALMTGLPILRIHLDNNEDVQE